jgi:hypothetical protein
MDYMTAASRPSSLLRRTLAFVVAVSLLAPLAALPAAMAQSVPPKPSAGMTGKQKTLLLAGAALLYYLYRKHQATATRTVPGTTATTGATATVTGRTPQLYRSKNGGIYYRDAQGRPVWLTVPPQGMQVPASDLQRYAPNYSQYQGPAPKAPSGYTTQPFSQFDPTLVPASAPTATHSNLPPGPGGATHY